jgi:tungstate transport system ATP-binding protein
MLYEIDALTRVHGARTVLDIPALAIRSGRIYSLIGPNGAGKSTLLHLLAFLDSPTSGVIKFRSTPVKYIEKSLLPLRRQVVLVDQYPILFTGSVWENLEFGLKVRKIETKRRRPLIEEALELVGMQDFFHAEAHTLSGGETKRVALARALVVQPDVLLCDEPTANVDVENLGIILDILEKVNKEQKISIIFATHSYSQARRFSRQTLILKDGRLSDLPRDNIFTATILGQAEGRMTCRLQNDIRITIPTAGRSFSNAEIIRLFLNPEYIVIVRERETYEGRHNLLPGKVVMITAENGRVRITTDIGISVNILLSQSEYAKIQPIIGEEILLSIEDRALTVE